MEVTNFISDGKSFSGMINGKTFRGHYDRGVAVIDSPSNLSSKEFDAIVAFLG